MFTDLHWLIYTCRNEHSGSLHFMSVAASYKSSPCQNGPLTLNRFSYLLCVFLLWNESRYTLLAFLHCSSVSLANVCPKEEEEEVEAQFTATTQDKYEKWFSFPLFNGLFYSIFRCLDLSVLTSPLSKDFGSCSRWVLQIKSEQWVYVLGIFAKKFKALAMMWGHILL